MKTGIIRKIDNLGRIIIPKSIRNGLGIKADDPIEISIENNKICLERYLPGNTDVLDTVIENIRFDDDIFAGKVKILSLLNEARELIATLK